MNGITLNAVDKAFGLTPVLTNLDLVVEAGSITAVLGASGSGKTTILRLIAGFERVDRGSIVLGDRVVDDSHRSLHPQHRGVGYVAQDGALFPHLSVLGNVRFGLPRARGSEADSLIDLVGLTGLNNRFPHELSGGQQQRVALARALAVRPAVVLLDEPFSSLDASLRLTLGEEILSILRRAGTTTVLVTHDQDEALGLADRIAVLRAGHIVVFDEPRRVYRDPPDLAAAIAIGDANDLAARVRGGVAECALGLVAITLEDPSIRDGPARLLLRPEQLVIGVTPQDGSVPGTVTRIQYHGYDTLVWVSVIGAEPIDLKARVPGNLPLEPRQSVWVHVVGEGRAWSDTMNS